MRTETEKLLCVKKKPEATFQTKFCDWLREQGGYVEERKQVKSGLYSNQKYTPDVFYYFFGYAYAFELKSKNGVLSDGQKLKSDYLRHHLKCVYVVNQKNFEEFKTAFLKELIERKRQNCLLNLFGE